MRSGDVALRFSIVFAVAGFITIAAGIYEIDRREKSSSETVTANLTEIEQRVRILSDQIRILNDQYTRQINANEREKSGCAPCSKRVLGSPHETRRRKTASLARRRLRPTRDSVKKYLGLRGILPLWAAVSGAPGIRADELIFD